MVYAHTLITKPCWVRQQEKSGPPWEKSEVLANLALEHLKKAPAIDGRGIDALIAFLKTLTDKRYEHLLEC
jgi:hypothetical protein